MDRDVARTIERWAFAATAVVAAAWTANQLDGPPTAVMVGAMSSLIALSALGVLERPLPGAWAHGVPIVLAGAVGVGATWLVIPIWSNGLGWWWTSHWFNGVNPNPWSCVCWPLLLGEQLLILLVTGGLLVVRPAILQASPSGGLGNHAAHH
jgi:hypothetical protein